MFKLKLEIASPIICGNNEQVCPQLSLPLIRRILCNFIPDEFSPEPVSPALLAAINTKVMETIWGCLGACVILLKADLCLRMHCTQKLAIVCTSETG